MKTLVQLGAQLGARTDSGDTPLDLSVLAGRHEAEQVLRELERTASTRRPAPPAEPSASAGGGTASACASCGGCSGAALKRCARCHSVKYCSATCQRAHWTVHKASCRVDGAQAGGAAVAWGQPAAREDTAEAREAAERTPPSASITHTAIRSAASLASSVFSLVTGRPGQAAGQALPPDAQAASDTQQPAPQTQAAGDSSKKDKDRQRKERQRQRKIDTASEMMSVAMAVMEESGVRCV